MRRRAADTRAYVLEVAHDLFYSQGIRATGVDLVAKQAEVAPTTLYRLFASKDDLVAAYVERADSMARGWFDAAVESAGPDPRARILAVFDALDEQIRPESYRGCACLMTLAEYPDVDSPSHKAAAAAKVWVHGRFTQFAKDLAKTHRLVRPAVLADELTLVFEGVHATASALGVDGPPHRARSLAEKILNLAMGTPAPPARSRAARR